MYITRDSCFLCKSCFSALSLSAAMLLFSLPLQLHVHVHVTRLACLAFSFLLLFTLLLQICVKDTIILSHILAEEAWICLCLAKLDWASCSVLRGWGGRQQLQGSIALRCVDTVVAEVLITVQLIMMTFIEGIVEKDFLLVLGEAKMKDTIEGIQQLRAGRGGMEWIVPTKGRVGRSVIMM